MLNYFIDDICYIHFSDWDYVFHKKLDKLINGMFGPGMPPLSQLQKRAAIAFVNTNPAFDHPAPLQENIIPVGGLQIGDTKPLPKVSKF